MKKTKVGLMLGGGGAKGAYQVGVIKALEEENLLKHVKVISGTSIGAINTLLLMAKNNHSRIEEIWKMIDNEGVYGDGLKIEKNKQGLYSLDPLCESLSKHVELKKIAKSKYTGYATAALMLSKHQNFLTQLMPSTMEKHSFKLNTHHDPFKAVMASASIPVLFGTTYIDGIPYVDGGVLDNYPMEPLIKEECDVIWAVAVDSRFNPGVYDNLDVNIVDFSSRAAFSKSLLADFIQAVQFTSDLKDSKFELGYLVGKIMIEKMYDDKLIVKKRLKKRVVRKEGFYSLGLDKDEEAQIKQFNANKNNRRLENE